VNEARSRQLEASNDMVPVEGSVDIDIPADVLWDFFARPDLWSRWNPCFLWVLNTALVKDESLIWCFQPIKKYYPYVMPAIATIIELEPGRKVTWEVTALPGFYAHHTYSIEPIGPGRSRFRSWERRPAAGFSPCGGSGSRTSRSSRIARSRAHRHSRRSIAATATCTRWPSSEISWWRSRTTR
jgi:hypothetical protein